MRNNMKRIATTLGLGAVVVIGAAQLATSLKADPPPSKCIDVLCATCPDGFGLSPTPGNCCRCVKVR